MKKIIIAIVITGLILGGWHWLRHDGQPQESVSAEKAVMIKPDRVEKIEIITGSTFGKLMTDSSDLDANTVNGIYKTSQDIYDLAKIRVGRFLELVYDAETDEFKEFRYKIDGEEQLVVFKNSDFVELELTVDSSATIEQSDQAVTETEIDDVALDREVESAKEAPYWQAEIQPIPYETKIKVSEGVVETSVYQAALNNDIDERAIIDLANVFQWTIDFAMDPRVGDEFKFIYEERYLDGEYVMPGRILAAKYVNSGKVFDHYYFKEHEDNKGYFDGEGNSVQKIFLKSPVEFRYISSGYTTGNRVVMEVGLSGPHRAIDYAASTGTPIRTVGGGVVTEARYNGCYGNIVTIRHNGTYTTRYAHQSKMAVRVGQRVKQGEVIGYVGSTGCSTGPHVHFEMIKHGNKVDPLKEILPPGDAIKAENIERFYQEIAEWKQVLDL